LFENLWDGKEGGLKVKAQDVVFKSGPRSQFTQVVMCEAGPGLEWAWGLGQGHHVSKGVIVGAKRIQSAVISGKRLFKHLDHHVS